MCASQTLGGEGVHKHGHLSRNFSDIPGNKLIKEQDHTADSSQAKRVQSRSSIVDPLIMSFWC
jgi:hypothetical protein